MKISTKGHYAVQAMVDLAACEGAGPVCLSMIAERQGLSQNYLEQLFVKLRKAGLVKSVRGPGGGYTLGKTAETISIGEIFAAVEESLVLIDCVDTSGLPDHVTCDKSSGCLTQTLWARLCHHFNDLMYSVTLGDVLRGEFDFPAIAHGVVKG